MMDRHSVNWRDYIPAIITPFDKEGMLDEETTIRLYQFINKMGTFVWT